MPRRRGRCRTIMPIAGRDWRNGSIRTSRSRSVIPGRDVVANPESRDSGSGPSDHPGMTGDRVRRNIRRKSAVPHPNDPSLRSFIPVDPTSDFPIQNLPYGVFSTRDGLAPRVGVAIGDYVLDLWELEQNSRLNVGEVGVFAASSLNPFMALGPKVWSRTRARISELLRHDHPELRDNDELRRRALVPIADVKLHLPVAVAGYTDFYSSKEHATNVGV